MQSDGHVSIYPERIVKLLKIEPLALLTSGVSEQIEDLQPFDPKSFVDGLVAP